MSLSVKYDIKVNLGKFYIYQSNYDNDKVLSPSTSTLRSLVASFHKRPTLLQCYVLLIFNLAQPHLKPINCSEKFFDNVLCVKPNNTILYEVSKNNDALENNVTIKCGSGEFVSTAYKCDGYQDCIDNSDELNCHCNYRGQVIFDSKFCSTNCTLNIKYKCSNLYHNFDNIGCKSFLLVKKYNVKENPSSSPLIHCNSFQKSTAFIDDLIFDCPAGKDEPELLEIEINYNQTCIQIGMLECYAGHSQCYSEREKCIYNLTKVTHLLMYCRNGKHLEDCNTFTCQGMFKCPNSYCIPFRYKCDGKWDCWNGIDECNCKNIICFKMYKCHHSKVCIHTKNVCDYIDDCPLNDDERLCNVNKCLAKCSCINLGILCENITFSKGTLFSLQHYIYIQIIDSNINNVRIDQFEHILFLIVSKNSMIHKSSYLCSSSFSPIKLITLDLSFNLSGNIIYQQFTCLPSLRVLDLGSNTISVLNNSPFRSLKSLKLLDLYGNGIRLLLSCAFCGLNNLLFLQLKGNDIFQINKDVFTNVHPKFTSTSSFHVCCIVKIKTSVCTAEPIWPASCEAMVGVKNMKEMTWVMSFSVIINNILSLSGIILPWYLTKQLNEYKKWVLLINICDLIIGLYLLTVSVKAATEGLNYFYVDLIWRSSFLCYSISFMFLVSISLSPLYLLAVSVSRYRAIKDPFKKSFSKRTTSFISIYFPLFVMIIASTILYIRHSIEGLNYLSSPLCIVLARTDESVTQFVVTITLSLYFVILFVIIAVNHCKLAFLTRRSESMISELKQRERFKIITKHIIVVGLTNALCWFCEVPLGYRTAVNYT